MINKIVISILLLTLPLITISSLYDPYELPKFILFLITILVLAIVNLFRFSKGLDQQNNFKLTKLTVFISIYVFIVFIADLYGIDPKISILGSDFRHQGLFALMAMVIFYLIVNLSKKDWLNYFLKIVAISGVLVLITALYQIIQIYLLKQTILTYNGRIIGTFGNPNLLAGFLAITLPFILLNQNFKISHIFKFILLFLFGVAIFFTGSKSGLIAYLFVTASYLIFLFKTNRVLALLLILFSIFIANFMVGKINLAKFFSRDSIYEERGLIYREGFKGFLREPILGFGQENFELVFPSLQKMMRVDNAHNIFLEILVSSGILGFIAFTLILIEALKKGDYLIRVVLIAFLIRAMFNPLSIPEIMVFWFTLALN